MGYLSRVLKWCALGFVLACCGFLQAREKFDVRAEVIIDGAAVYSLPNFDATIVNYLDQGQKIYIAGHTHEGYGGLGLFYKIKAGRVTGFVADVDVRIMATKRKPRKEKKFPQALAEDKKATQNSKPSKSKVSSSKNKGSAKKRSTASKNKTEEELQTPLTPIVDEDSGWDDEEARNDLFSMRFVSALYQPRVFFKSGPSEDKMRLHHVMAVQWHEPSVLFKKWPVEVGVAYGPGAWGQNSRDEQVSLWVFSLATGLSVLSDKKFLVQLLAGPLLRFEPTRTTRRAGAASPTVAEQNSVSFLDKVGAVLKGSAAVRVAGPLLLRAEVAYHVRDFRGVSPLVIAAGLAYAF